MVAPLSPCDDTRPEPEPVMECMVSRPSAFLL